jgi:hypothetical protein
MTARRQHVRLQLVLVDRGVTTADAKKLSDARDLEVRRVGPHQGPASARLVTLVAAAVVVGAMFVASTQHWKSGLRVSLALRIPAVLLGGRCGAGLHRRRRLLAGLAGREAGSQRRAVN